MYSAQKNISLHTILGPFSGRGAGPRRPNPVTVGSAQSLIPAVRSDLTPTNLDPDSGSGRWIGLSTREPGPRQ